MAVRMISARRPRARRPNRTTRQGIAWPSKEVLVASNPQGKGGCLADGMNQTRRDDDLLHDTYTR